MEAEASLNKNPPPTLSQDLRLRSSSSVVVQKEGMQDMEKETEQKDMASETSEASKCSESSEANSLAKQDKQRERAKSVKPMPGAKKKARKLAKLKEWTKRSRDLKSAKPKAAPRRSQ